MITERTAGETAALQIDFCFWAGCPTHPAAWSELLRALLVYGALSEIRVHEVVSDEDAARLKFYGSPTIRIDGRDIDEPSGSQAYSVGCRLYPMPDGGFGPMPYPAAFEHAVQRALDARGMSIAIDVAGSEDSVAARVGEFSLPGGDGELHGPVSGRATVIGFWATDCPYVRVYEDRVDALARAHPDIDFLMICANRDDSLDAVVERTAERPGAFTVVYDESGETAKLFGATRTPEMIVYDEAGNLRYHGAVDDSWEGGRATRHYLHDCLVALASGEAPPVEQTPLLGCWITGQDPAAA